MLTFSNFMIQLSSWSYCHYATFPSHFQCPFVAEEGEVHSYGRGSTF